MAREFFPIHSMSGLYGGMARSTSENEILRTMTNGTTKNRSSHRYGSATTRPRPEMPNRRRYEVVFIESAGHNHRARRIPRQIHLLIPRDGLGMARRIRLGYAYDLAG